VDKEKPDLAVLVEGDSILFNQYGVMAVNPKKYPHVKFDAAKKFINFLVSEKGQKAIGSFKDSRGNQLFYPNAK
jgi:tungstate transport system substrate-binding protein